MSPRHGQRDSGVPPWAWIGCGCCLGCLAIPVLIAVIFGGGALALLSRADVFEEAIERARTRPEVVAALGEPITRGWMIQGQFNFEGDSGEADLSVPISGPAGSAKLWVVGHKEAGEWSYDRLEVELDDTGERIDLLEEPPAELPPALDPI